MTFFERASDVPRKEAFLTGTTYFGKFTELGMQDHGTYRFPDGTQYDGNFMNNRFHGKGSIQTTGPEGVTFTVTHKHGRLMSIDKIEFNDRLGVDFEIKKDHTIGFKPWKYCTPQDRRFHREITGTMEAVGPESFKYKGGANPPALAHNIFDLGFGLLSRQGFMLDTKAFSNQSFYLGCRVVRRWIRENCRHGNLAGTHIKQKVQARFTRDIMDKNLKAAGDNYIPQSRVCRRSTSLDSFGSRKSTRVHLESSNGSCSSDAEQLLKRYRTCAHKFRRCKSESSVCHIN
ncbi:MORN repeat-containing protein 5 [Drosophila serrata]|uniref:MORN repeat-containing protein 5 n=1 Tax=Drosophila serrata TaxID=7274 RepID=UPI000A1D20AB|nr:MORN repeat-containing protein 5 [Drosophila serrata]